MTLGTNSTTQSLQKHILKSWNKGKLMAQNDFLNLYLSSSIIMTLPSPSPIPIFLPISVYYMEEKLKRNGRIGKREI